MKKPGNRRERIAFLISKKGRDVALLAHYATLTDKELKDFVDAVYPTLVTQDDYNPIIAASKPPNCHVCGDEVVTTTTWDCDCGHAVIDPDDPSLPELRRDFLNV